MRSLDKFNISILPFDLIIVRNSVFVLAKVERAFFVSEKDKNVVIITK
jgi:hypothetical protein